MYESSISRKNPGCILLLLDQSGSMNEPFAGDPGTSKATAVANVANELILEIVLKCQRGMGVSYHYFDLGVIGYGTDGGANFAWRGPLRDRGLVPSPEVRDNVIRVEERIAKGESDASPHGVPIWLDPVAENGTPMAEALAVAGDTLWQWVTSHPNSFPPMVFLITGGQANPVLFAGADTSEWAKRLKMLATRDGTLLLYNLYLSSVARQPVLFPETSSELPDGIAEALFQMSSILPAAFKRDLTSAGYELKPGARGFAVNDNIVRLTQALKIGTRVEMRD